MKRYTFSKSEIDDEMKRLSALKKLMHDNNRETEVAISVVYDDDDHSDEKPFAIPNRSKVYNSSNENTLLKTEILSLKEKIKDLENCIGDAKVLEGKRIEEIDKWHGMYDHAEAEITMWRQKYEVAKETTKTAEFDKLELDRLKHENARLHLNVAHLQTLLENEKATTAIAKRYMGDKTLASEGVWYYNTNDDVVYKRKEKALEDKIKTLQEKLGNESVPLSVLAEGLKDYAEEAGIHEAHELFNHLNNLLINVPAWTKNVPELKKFFKKARKEMEGRNVTLTGEFATYNENNNK